MNVVDLVAVVPWLFALPGALWTTRLAIRSSSDTAVRPAFRRSARRDVVLAVLAMVLLAVHRTDMGMSLAGCYVSIVATDVLVIRPITRGRRGDSQRCGAS